MEAGMRLLAAALVVCAASAFAQDRPSFDCAKTSTKVGRTICGNAELARADREMAAAYAALVAKLAGAAREHLASDQLRWAANRDRACAIAGDDIDDCLKLRYGSRSEQLAFLAAGDYPFISEQALVRTGKVKRVDFRIDAAYPQFDAKSTDFTQVNRSLAEWTEKAASQAIPAASKIDDDVEQEWSYEQNFQLYRPNRRAVSVAVSYRTYTGGAHGYIATDCFLVDLRTAKLVGLEEIFVPGEQWLKRLMELVRNDLKEQFVDRPGNDALIEPENMTEMLKQGHRYLFRDDNTLEVIFNPYEVGPYAAGPYSVEISYDDLRSIIRTDGPLGD
jgi:uncharacterized protein